MGPININFKILFLVFGLMCAVAGWGLIELIMWIFNHVSFNWN